MNESVDTPGADARHVFVYGTLRRGEANDITLLTPAPHWVGPATVHGCLHVLGWYPGLVLGGELPVVGEVYRVTPELERRLDEIEGLLPEPTGEYLKREIEVSVNGQLLLCFLYEIAPSVVLHVPALDGGDWTQRPNA